MSTPAEHFPDSSLEESTPPSLEVVERRYPDFEIELSETGLYGSGVLEANEATRFGAVLAGLRRIAPETLGGRDIYGITARLRRLDAYLAQTVTKHGPNKWTLPRKEALPFDEVAGGIFERMVEENHPVAQIFQKIDTGRMSEPDFRQLFRKVIKITAEDEIRETYSAFSKELHSPKTR